MRKVILIAAWCTALLWGQQPPVEAAWNLLAKGQREEAVRVLRLVISDHPGDADARLLLGSIFSEDGKGPEAISQLTEAVRLRPRSAEAHNALGEALNSFGDEKQAREEFERTIAIDPAFAAARVNLAQILVQAHEFAAAVPHLDRALQLLAKSADAAEPHYLRAKINVEVNELRQAATHLSVAVALRPDFAEAWSDLGQVRRLLDDNAGAIAAFKEAVRLAPDDSVAQYRLGSEYLHQKEAALAVVHLQKALAANPDDQSALYALQVALRQNGQPEDARVAKEKLADLLHRRDEAAERELAGVQLNNQGVELEKAGKLGEALLKYRAALDLCRDHVGFRVNYAAALLHLGHKDEGIAQLREAIRRDPRNKAVQQALATAERK